MPKVYDGPQVKAMFATATRWLEMNCEAINALNVFPVPDGDTGINMLFTMRAAMEEVEKGKGQDASSVAGALAWGALMGARGNSGVILSQILRGFSNGVEGESAIDGNSLARGLRQATTAAYKGVSKPVEGTILTVIKDASEAAHKASEESDDLEDVLAAAVEEARQSVERTPSLLPILREAGVVDAGGQGLLVILEGALKALRNEPLVAPPQPQDTDAISRVSRAGVGVEEQVYGFCAQFLIQGEGLDPESVRQEIDQRGNSTVVVGAEDLIRVHTHTPQPDAVIAFAETLGTVTQVNVQDIDQQHSAILQKKSSEDVGPIAMVVVASGQGITELFSSLGASVVVPGGQTMNPSTQDILTAIESTSAPAVIVLPNNKNIMPAAKQAAALSEKEVEVVPSITIPQGIASILAFNIESTVAENQEVMNEALSGVRTLELTRAVRRATVNGLRIRKGEAIGLLDGELLASASGPCEVIQALASRMASGGISLATVYWGADTDADERNRLAESLKDHLPDVEVEMLDGGQPHYDFIISLE